MPVSLPLPAATAARLLALAALCSLTACAGSPRIDRQFGSSVRLAQSQQTIDPQAGATRPVNGMDAQAAASAYEAYQRSFSTPTPQQNNFTIGAGFK
jgi:hypothetical protein